MRKYLALLLGVILVVGSGCHQPTSTDGLLSAASDSVSMGGYHFSLSVKNIIESYYESVDGTVRLQYFRLSGGFYFSGTLDSSSSQNKNTMQIKDLSCNNSHTHQLSSHFVDLPYFMVGDTTVVLIKGLNAIKNILDITDENHTSWVTGSVGSGHFVHHQDAFLRYVTSTDSTEVKIVITH